jgi:3-oxoacyl-[acyl-carrier-protein] synthase III
MIAEASLDKCDTLEKYYISLRILKRRCKDLYEKLVKDKIIEDGFNDEKFDVNIGDKMLRNFLDKWKGDPRSLDKADRLIIHTTLQRIENAITKLKGTAPEEYIATKDEGAEELAKKLGIK